MTKMLSMLEIDLNRLFVVFTSAILISTSYSNEPQSALYERIANLTAVQVGISYRSSGVSRKRVIEISSYRIIFSYWMNTRSEFASVAPSPTYEHGIKSHIIDLLKEEQFLELCDRPPLVYDEDGKFRAFDFVLASDKEISLTEEEFGEVNAAFLRFLKSTAELKGGANQ